MTPTGYVGTNGYRDPLADKEFAKEKATHDGADMWALTVMAFKLLCRRYPFGDPHGNAKLCVAYIENS
jgi:hypothetical protein